MKLSEIKKIISSVSILFFITGSAFCKDSSDSYFLFHELRNSLTVFAQDFSSTFSDFKEAIYSVFVNNKGLVIALAVVAGIFLLGFLSGSAVFFKQFFNKWSIHRFHEKSFFRTFKDVKEETKEIEDLGQFKELADKCEKLGKKVDLYTERFNNSKRVSELVYRISRKIGINPSLSALYFCAALVYDAGFLAIPEDYFKVEILTKKEKKQLRTHVYYTSDYLDFVPPQYLQTFIQASTMHHENLDGTGYPEGITGEYIEPVAKIIHVVETYVSLTSPRSYHRTRTKEDVLAELKSYPGWYDSQILKALEESV